MTRHGCLLPPICEKRKTGRKQGQGRAEQSRRCGLGWEAKERECSLTLLFTDTACESAVVLFLFLLLLAFGRAPAMASSRGRYSGHKDKDKRSVGQVLLAAAPSSNPFFAFASFISVARSRIDYSQETYKECRELRRESKQKRSGNEGKVGSTLAKKGRS